MFISKSDFLQKNHFTINKISISGFIYNANGISQPQYDKAYEAAHEKLT
jgi:hypothetical protein